jgi:hypothetical protein
VDPPNIEASKAVIDAAEARMRQAETFTWAVPGLAIASQALLLTVALRSDYADWAQALAALAALLTLLPALHFLGKHTFNFDVYDAVIERERIRLGWPRMTRDYLLAEIESFPNDCLLRQREWWKDEHRERKHMNDVYRAWMHFRNPLIVKFKAVWVWSGALVLLGIVDVGVLLYVVSPGSTNFAHMDSAHVFLIVGLVLTLVGAAVLSYRDFRPRQNLTYEDNRLGFPRREAWLGFPLIVLGSVLQIVGVLLD